MRALQEWSIQVSIPNPADPSVSAEQLAALAGSDPSAWPAILQNPNCYPALREWIQGQMTSVPSAEQPQETQQYSGQEFAATTQSPEVTEVFEAQRTEVFQPGFPAEPGAGPQYAMPSQDFEVEPKKSTAWIWWVVGAVVLIAVAVGLLLWSPWSSADTEADVPETGELAPTTDTDPEGAAPVVPEENDKPAGGNEPATEASAEAFCSAIKDANTSMALDDPEMISKAAQIFTDSAAVAPPEVKADVELLAEYMNTVSALDMSDPNSMDLSELEKLSEQTVAVTESSTKLNEWVANNCWK